MSSHFDNQALAFRTDGLSVGHALPDPIENAIAFWAEASTRAETRDREERLRDKKQVIRSFLKYVGKHPGEVGPADVRAWRKHLESLKSENTVYSYLSRVSSFYEWLRKYPEIKDHIHSNPVSMARPTAPRPYQTRKTRAWTDDEMNAILNSIAGEAERGSIHALRDYALTLFYLYSGLRRNEVFGLRGGDVELQEGDPATVLTWPPKPPAEGDVVMYGGYPAMYREERPGNVHFMFASFAGKVASASDRNVGMVLEIERSESISPSRIPPNADLGGWSGGPVFRVVDSNGIERLELAAIIYEYSALSEIAFAHPLSSLAEDGHFIE